MLNADTTETGSCPVCGLRAKDLLNVFDPRTKPRGPGVFGPCYDDSMAVDAANVGVPGQYDALVVFAFVVAFADSYGIGVLRTRERQRERKSEKGKERTK